MKLAAERSPINMLKSKEEYGYRTLFEEHFTISLCNIYNASVSSMAGSTAIPIQ